MVRLSRHPSVFPAQCHQASILEGQGSVVKPSDQHHFVERPSAEALFPHANSVHSAALSTTSLHRSNSTYRRPALLFDGQPCRRPTLSIASPLAQWQRSFDRVVRGIVYSSGSAKMPWIVRMGGSMMVERGFRWMRCPILDRMLTTLVVVRSVLGVI